MQILEEEIIASERVPKMTSQGLTNVLWSYATLRYFPRELLVAIAQELYERLPTLHVQVGHPPNLLTHPVDHCKRGAPVCVHVFFHDEWATPLDPPFLATPSSAASVAVTQELHRCIPVLAVQMGSPPTCSITCRVPLYCMSLYPDQRIRQHVRIPERSPKGLWDTYLVHARTIKWLRQSMQQQPVASVHTQLECL